MLATYGFPPMGDGEPLPHHGLEREWIFGTDADRGRSLDKVNPQSASDRDVATESIPGWPWRVAFPCGVKFRDACL